MPSVRLASPRTAPGRRRCRFLVALSGLAWLLFASSSHAHPEDEFCLPGQPGIDPALCRAIAALDPEEVGNPDTVLQPLTDEAGNVRGFGSTFLLYVQIGIGHILPGGLDHILFVLALCLGSNRWRELVLQISTFTVAHTATLALAAAGVIAPPAAVVEPLIAATIAFVAVENLVFRDIKRWRLVVVFGFGLVHGLGFAGFFGELGLPPNQFWSALLGFNLGVEIGQLSVVVIAVFLMLSLRQYLARSARPDLTYRRWLVQPASAMIAATGLWWAIARSLPA